MEKNKETTNNRKNILKWITSLTLVNCVLYVLFGLRYMNYIDINSDFYQILYIGITSLGHMGSIPFIALILLVLCGLFVKNRKLLLGISSTLFTVGLIYLSIDSFIFSQYRFHFNKFVLDMLLGGAAGDIFQFSFFMYFASTAFLISIIALQILIGKWIWNKNLYKKLHTKTIVISILILMVVSQFSHTIAAANGYTPITKVARAYPLHFPLTANTLLTKLHLVNKEALAMNKAPKYKASSKLLKYPAQELQYKETSKPNILLIAIDCWRGDCLDSLITPNIYKFSKRSQVFTDHQSGSSGTRGSIFSMFYGLPSFAYWHSMKTNYQRPVMMQRLADQGYDFGIFGSSNITNPAFHRTVFAGIDNLRLETKCENRAPHVRDAKITEEWLSFMNQKEKCSDDRPFFGFLFYDAAHGYSHPDPKSAPFQPSWDNPKYMKLDNDLNPTAFFNLFKNSLNYIDGMVGKVLAQLEDSGELDNTIVILTGDHGQEFNDNKKNYWGHGSNYSRAQLHVPMVMHFPGKGHKVHKHATYHYDIAPTLMQDYLGCTNKLEDYTIGKSLWENNKKPYFVAGSDQNYAVIENQQITTVVYGNYFVSTPDMKDLDNSNLNSSLVFKAMKDAYRFYNQL